MLVELPYKTILNMRYEKAILRFALDVIGGEPEASAEEAIDACRTAELHYGASDRPMRQVAVEILHKRVARRIMRKELHFIAENNQPMSTGTYRRDVATLRYIMRDFNPE